MDANGHGTRVVGTIGAVGNNSRGVTGVSWTAKLLPLRAFDASGYGTTSDILSAMMDAGNYAATNNTKVVINASYGGSDFSQAEYDEISNLNAAGILLVAAASDDGTDNDSYSLYPASYELDNIVAVAATDQNDNLACFSGYGQSSVDVAAPGTNIYSGKPGRQTVFSDNFDDGDISNWTVEPPWGLSTFAYGGTGYSLADSPTGNYANNINISARPTKAIDLSGQTGTVLDFQLNGTIAQGDALYVETATVATGPWTTLLGLSGSSNGEWLNISIDLGKLDGAATAYFRFRLQTNGSGTADGVYIDNAEVTTAAVRDTYQFLDGTSMATAHVTGLSALVWANSSTLSHLQVKERTLNSVDRLPVLSTTTPVFTQGRINASNSIRNVPAPPVGLSATAASASQINLTWANTYYGQIGFKIERQGGTTGTFTQIADLNSNTTSYSDTGLTASTTYIYRLRAYTSDNPSAYSSEVSATTPAPHSGGGGGGGGGCFIDTALPR
jgi:subtilisin family serine protease